MKKIVAAIIFAAFTMALQAQSWELKVNAGGNTTFVDGIQNYFMIASKVKNPYELLNPIGFNPTLIAVAPINNSISINNKIGYYAEGELVRHLPKNWALSLSLGINKISYSYDMTLSEGDTKLNIKDLDKNYGETRFLYIHSRVLNVSKTFSNLGFSAGPVISYLIHNKKFNNLFTADNGNNTITTLLVPQPAPAKFLYGGNVSLNYKLAKPIELKAGVQYFFNSVYKKDENKVPFGDSKDVKVNPFQITLGLSYSLTKF